MPQLFDRCRRTVKTTLSVRHPPQRGCSARYATLAGIRLTLALALAGCTPAGPPDVARPALMVTEGADGSTQVLRPGQPLEVRLPGNPSTGFRWEAALGERAALRQEGEPRFERGDAPAGVVGAGGTEVFRFVAVAPGRQELSFVYRRVWETDVPPARTVSFRVSVEGR